MSNRARQRNKNKQAQQERSAANRAENPDKFSKNNVISGRKKPNPGAWDKKYTVDPNKRQMGRAAAKRRMEAGNESSSNNNEKTGTITSSDYGKNASGSTEAHKQSNIRDRGGLLRYPLEAMTDSTDYLQIDITKYVPVKEKSGGLVSSVGSRKLSGRSPVRGFTATQSLVNQGTVLLQIPSQIQDGNSASYGESSMNSLVGAAAGGISDLMTKVGEATGKGQLTEAGQASKDSLNNALASSGLTVDSAKSLITKKLAASATSILGGNVSINQLLAREQGQVLNPNMELLFNGPTLRNFRFSFKMTPRSEKEAEQCKLIIRTFKMNMAPKVTGSGANLFLNTPNVFELRYKSGFRNHPFLHKFKQCFLTDISVNYTAEGVYATYENKEPISMTMDLTFKELEPIYDNDYFDERGYDSDSTVGY
tara:strand:- start:1094 stop:2362 length:1269 start_codon:yes stop_codon:yes gene_type:complete